MIVSSAKSVMLLCIVSGISFMYKRNKQGPSTEPCGTPDITGHDSDSSPSRTTRCDLPERKDPIQVMTSLLMLMRWTGGASAIASDGLPYQRPC